MSSFRQELAVKSADLSHLSTSLSEHKDSLAHARSQLASVQDNLSGQLRALQRELSATQAEKLQSDRQVGRLTQEGVRGVSRGVRDLMPIPTVAASGAAKGLSWGRGARMGGNHHACSL